MTDQSDVCPGCGCEIDPEVCYCGVEEDSHGWVYDHPFIPMGCDCYRDQGDSDD